MDIEKSYNNAYQLLVGETTYNKLAEQKEFYLPTDHHNASKLLSYFESIEDYEKCSNIVKKL
jgi:hypothetical protein